MIILLVSLGFALAPRAEAQTAAPFQRTLRATLSVAFAAIGERHIEARLPAELTLAWVAGLSDIEPLLSARQSGQRIELLFEGRFIAAQPLPASTGAAATAATRLADAAIAVSAAIQRAEPAELLAAGFASVFRPLDPFSRFVPAIEAAAARSERSGRVALGLRLGVGRNGRPTVTAASPGSPGAVAGVRVGDEVRSVDGVPVSAADLALAALLLDGPEGTDAVLGLRRGTRTLSVRVRRQPAAAASLSVERQPGGILVLRVPAFPAGTAGRVVAAITDNAPRGVVLDLRGNRGGLLTEAVAVADLFLDAGQIGSSSGRHPDANRTWHAVPPDILGGLPVVVLVDQRTASAAEMLAAALAERSRGAVVGSTTRGKGLIQIVIPLPGEAELHVSWARLSTPLGQVIEGVGLTPDFCTSVGPDAAEQALDRLLLDERRFATTPDSLTRARERGSDPLFRRPRPACPQSDGNPWDERLALALISSEAAYHAVLRR